MKTRTYKQQLTELREKYFPERQIFLRSQGRVRFVTLKSNIQIATAAVLCVGVAWLITTSFTFMTRDLLLESQKTQISTLNAENAALNADFDAVAEDINQRTQQLEQRQKLLEDALATDAPAVEDPETAPEDGLSPPLVVSDASETPFLERLMGTGTAVANSRYSTRDKLSFMINTLKTLNAQQQVLASDLLGRSHDALNDIDAVLAATPLSTKLLAERATKENIGLGGPLIPEIPIEPLFDAGDAENFVQLQANLLRLDVATSALQSFPTGEPAAKYYISSRFGTRSDPFTKKKARHPGLDMAGWPGTAIMATSAGTVVKAGTWGAYGNMVEIDHGNGIRTRYGHMKKLHVKRGDHVTQGQQIGEMGKSGRATSSHLHYEIWYESTVRDPLPFLKAADDVRKIQGRYEKS